jgi:hypothetical protein
MSDHGYQLRIYPAFDAFYYSFYWEGLRAWFSPSEITFSRQGFPPFGRHGLGLRVEAASGPRAGELRRIFISASDGPAIPKEALGWGDVVGKVNLDPSWIPATAKTKCMAIGPSFGVRAWKPAGAWALAAANFIRLRGQVPSAREHFAGFRRQYRYRLPLDAYRPGEVEHGYVFFLSRLWRKEEATNRLRSHFVQACQELPGIRFDGGFAPRTHDDIEGFAHQTAAGMLPFSRYLERTRRSTFVFNTPAVSQCHGWKLGEFLALGKAIISTPLSRQLPAPLEHGTHLHMTDGSPGEIQEACRKILGDNDYRRRLETHARQYFESYLRPARVIERLFAAADLPL